MTQKPKAQQGPARPVQLGEWMKQKGSYTLRHETYQVAKLVALGAIETWERQKREFRWYRRLWRAIQRLFAPAVVEQDLAETELPGIQAPAEPEGAPDGGGGFNSTPVAEGKTVQTDEGVKVTDRRAGRS